MKFYAVRDHEGRYRNACGSLTTKPSLWQSIAFAHSAITYGRSRASRRWDWQYKYVDGKSVRLTPEEVEAKKFADIAEVEAWEIVEFELVERSSTPASSYVRAR